MKWYKESVHSRRSMRDGFTLIETIIATGLVALVAGSLYAGGIGLLKLSAINKLTIEARALGVQKLEEIVAGGFNNMLSDEFTPLQTQTNFLSYVNTYNTVIRRATVIGHAMDRSVVASLSDSDYLEVHVEVMYQSPFSGVVMTNRFSTLVVKGS